jgi:hypothetical protein
MRCPRINLLNFSYQIESALIGPYFLCNKNVQILELVIVHEVIQSEALTLLSVCHTPKTVHVLQEKRQRSNLKLRDPALTIIVKAFKIKGSSFHYYYERKKRDKNGHDTK